MRKLFLSVVVFLSAAFILNANTDYASLLDAVGKFQKGYSDTNALKVINDVVHSGACDELRALCESIYTLHMGAAGDEVACREGVNAISDRYANSVVVRLLGVLELFPEPCAECLATGNANKQKDLLCNACSNTGKCITCGGYCQFKICPNCSQIFTHDVLIKMGYPNWDRNFCPNCQAKQAVKLTVTPCEKCKQLGICPQCQGAAGKTHKACPICKGNSKSVDRFAAQCGLERFCKDTKAALTKAVECEKEYAEILKISDPGKKLAALNECLAKYDGAYNIALLLEARSRLAKQMTELEALGNKEEEMRLEHEKRLAEQKQGEIKAHHSFLSKLRQEKSKRVALIELRKYLAENPESPVIADARILGAEMEVQLRAENIAAKRWWHFGIGCLAIVVLGFLTRALSSTRSRLPQKVVIPDMPDATFDEYETSPASTVKPEVVANDKPSIIVVYPVTVDTPETNMIACAECGDLMECAPEVTQEIVICYSCKKAFRVH